MSSAGEISFFDPGVNRCPYPAYKQLQDESPVWQDPQTGMYVITRYDDLRDILMDRATFTNRVGSAAGMTERAVRPSDPEEAARMDTEAEWERKIKQVYIDEGWETVGTLDALDPPEHGQLRAMFQVVSRHVIPSLAVRRGPSFRSSIHERLPRHRDEEELWPGER